MKRKYTWMILPVALFPYMALLALSTIFLSTKHPVFRFLMESVFRSDALLLIGLMLLLGLIAVVLAVLYFVRALRRRADALFLAKMAMILKLAQVPAYALIFAVSVAFVIAMLLIPFAIGLYWVDLLTLWLSGLLMLAAVVNAVRQGAFRWQEVLWVVLLQFVFCADVIASVVFYGKLRKKYMGKAANTITKNE